MNSNHAMRKTKGEQVAKLEQARATPGAPSHSIHDRLLARTGRTLALLHLHLSIIRSILHFDPAHRLFRMVEAKT
jgi:hypothetical protein